MIGWILVVLGFSVFILFVAIGVTWSNTTDDTMLEIITEPQHRPKVILNFWRTWALLLIVAFAITLIVTGVKIGAS